MGGAFSSAPVDYTAKVRIDSRHCVKQLEIMVGAPPVKSGIRNALLNFNDDCTGTSFDAIPTKSLTHLAMWNGANVTLESSFANPGTSLVTPQSLGRIDAASETRASRSWPSVTIFK